MKVGVFFFGGVEMDDAGAGPPSPQDRRFSQDECWYATERLVDLGVLADQLGYDFFWLTEHHFQHEGYEVVPNGILVGHVAGGQDPARADRHDVQHRPPVASAPPGRGLRHAPQLLRRTGDLRRRAGHGAPRDREPRRPAHLDRLVRQPRQGRGRHARTESCSTSRWRSSSAPSTTRRSRSRAGTSSSRPPASPTAASTSQHLTLVPRPRYPDEIWQPVTSPPTLDYVPGTGHDAVFWNQHHSFVKRQWDRYAELWAETPRHRAGAGRQPHAGREHPDRGQPVEGHGHGPPRPRRVLEVPRPLRLEQGLPGRRRQAGARRASSRPSSSRSSRRPGSSARPRTSPPRCGSTGTCSGSRT